MNSSFLNRWSFSYQKFTKYVTYVIAEPKYKYGQQEQVTVRNHNKRNRLGTVSIKILGGGGLNRFYGNPTSPSASVMTQNIQLFGPRVLVWLYLGKNVRNHNFQYKFSGILYSKVYFNTSAYVAIIWLTLDKKLTVLSKSQTELRAVKYGNPPKWSVQTYGRWPPLKCRQFLSMAVIFYGCILGKMLYFSIIMTTAGIKWCNDEISEIFKFCLKNMFLTKSFEMLIFVWSCCPHECKCKTENPTQIWALKRENWPFKNWF